MTADPPSPPQRPVARTVMWVSLLSCIGCSAECSRVWRAASRAETAMPLELAIDLSQAGITRGVLHQSYDESCNQLLILRPTGELAAAGDPAETLAGRQGSIRITDSSGETVKQLVLDGKNVRAHPSGEIVVSVFDPLNRGEYRIAVEILNGVAALTGSPQTLCSRYALCGLEYFPALGYAGFAAIWGLAAWIARSVAGRT